MDFISTRNNNLRQSLSDAIHCGIAPDGGLFVPEYFPQIDLNNFTSDMPLSAFANTLLQEFFLNDPLKEKLSDLCHNAFTFPIPLSKLNQNTFLLELFHGPTQSFKDFGARFLAECFNAIPTQDKTTIVVATSGDTGSAVASAFFLKNNINVIILYPKGKVSAKQEHQITCWDKNILALAVNGTFDLCQQLVKSVFQNPWWQKNMHPSSANSINIGRLLPQISYYAYSSMQFYHRYQEAPGFIVPTGNLGNATAGYWAKMMGFPIREIALATNANKTIPDYLHTGEFQPRPSIATLANAMDVGNPSNFERLHYLFNTFDSFKNHVQVISASDDDIRESIKHVYQTYNVIMCPHTATGYHARQKLSKQPWIITATADPGKFDTVIEPIIQKKMTVSPQLQILLDRPTRIIEIGQRIEDIEKILPAFLKRQSFHTP